MQVGGKRDTRLSVDFAVGHQISADVGIWVPGRMEIVMDLFEMISISKMYVICLTTQLVDVSPWNHNFEKT